MTFYSVAANFIVSMSPGKRVFEGGQSKVVDSKVLEFQPQGDGYGKLTTSDPEEIQFLSTRMTTVGDVFNGDEYTRRTTPAEIRLRMKETENQRLIEENNRLLRQLQSAGKLPSK